MIWLPLYEQFPSLMVERESSWDPMLIYQISASRLPLIIYPKFSNFCTLCQVFAWHHGALLCLYFLLFSFSLGHDDGHDLCYDDEMMSGLRTGYEGYEVDDFSKRPRLALDVIFFLR